MAVLVYKIQFFSEWHCGSGLTQGVAADSVVLRDANGLPFIPGRTIKGLLRHAAEEIAALAGGRMGVTERFIARVFGRQTQASIENDPDDQTEEGQCFFSNAVLPDELYEWLCGPPGEAAGGNDGKSAAAAPSPKRRSALFRTRAMTAIDERGQAKDHTLRVIETVVPLTLYGMIGNAEPDDEEAMRLCLQWIKRMGLRRHRGLGRCRFKLVEVREEA